MKFSFNAALAVCFSICTGVGAYAAQNCSELNASGVYKVSNTDQRYVVKQNGCTITVTDRNSVWRFDLTGRNLTKVPEARIDEARATNNIFEVKRLRSMEIQTVLEGNGSYFAVVGLRATMNLPKASNNPFDVDAEVNANMIINGVYSGKSDTQLIVNTVDFQDIKARLLAIHDWKYFGPLGHAFLVGANYILQNINVDGLVGHDLDMVRVQ